MNPTTNFAMLAPALACVPAAFQRAEVDKQQHAVLLAKLQRLRGRLYLEDGAIEPWQLTQDSRHVSVADDKSWHLLSMEDDQVRGCARLQVFEPTVPFADLAVSQSAQAQSLAWGPALLLSITAELGRAQIEGLLFVEAGGWALAPELRCTTEALRIALGSYSIGELLGGCLGLSTATVRHHSASILRRLGGCPLEWDNTPLPSYYDPTYLCEMEIVRFDSRMPNPKYRGLVHQLKLDLAAVKVFCSQDKQADHSQSCLPLSTLLGARRAGKASHPDSS